VRSIPHPARPRWVFRVTGLSPFWLGLALASVFLILCSETLLLGLATGFLTSGYNAVHIGPWEVVFAFLPASAVLDAWLVLAIWALLVPLSVRLGAAPLQVVCAAAIAGVGIPLALAAARYDLYSVVGNVFSLALAHQFSRLGVSEVLEQSFLQVPHFALAAALLAVSSVVAILLAERLEVPRLERSIEPPSSGALASGAAVTAALGVAILLANPGGSDLGYGFARKLSGQLLSRIVAGVTDADGDGFGLLERPVDPAPFDGGVHPYAIDHPGNGIDENGIGGDHPLEFEPDGRLDAAPVTSGPRPHLLVVYLESFRADLIGRFVNGRAVTPFMNSLAEEGASSQHAYVHAAWTSTSRPQLFGGRIINEPGASTIIDDFKARGYTVAHFSGQDDSYANGVEILGTSRADVFYDARQDRERRSSRSVAPVSLQVPCKVLVGRVLEYLETVDPRRPLFLYVNIVDTHYPYSHGEVDDLLGVEPLDRAGIRSSRAGKVFEAYANTAANVDRAVARVVAAFRESIDHADHAILVTADHGEEFYEHGLLGHGQSLDPLETRVPFIVWGMGGEWPEPIAASDVRWLLRRNLGTARGTGTPRAHFRPDPDRRILQYASALAEPRYIGLRGVNDAITYDFARDLIERTGEGGVHTGPGSAAQQRLFQQLVWRWEAAQRRALEPGQPPSRRLTAIEPDADDRG
jgi:hypothetical protein